MKYCRRNLLLIMLAIFPAISLAQIDAKSVPIKFTAKMDLNITLLQPLLKLILISLSGNGKLRIEN
jgi:hypothetical protein